MEHINLLRFLAPFSHHICTLMLVMNVMLCILIVYYECCRKLHWCMFCTKWQNKPYKLKTCFRHFTLLDWSQGHTYSTQWASYQVRKLRIALVLGMPGTFFPPTSKETASKWSRHASRHVRNARVVMHVAIANLRWWGKRSRYSRRMRKPENFTYLARGLLQHTIHRGYGTYYVKLWYLKKKL